MNAMSKTYSCPTVKLRNPDGEIVPVVAHAADRLLAEEGYTNVGETVKGKEDDEKIALENEARDMHGIELDRRHSLKRMKKEYDAALDEKGKSE